MSDREMSDRVYALLESILIQCAPDEKGHYDRERICWDVEQLARMALSTKHEYIPYKGPKVTASVVVEDLSDEYRTWVIIGNQRFSVSRVEKSDDDARRHCMFVRDMFAKALVGLGVPVAVGASFVVDESGRDAATHIKKFTLNDDFQATFDAWKAEVEAKGGRLRITHEEVVSDGTELLIFWYVKDRFD